MLFKVLILVIWLKKTYYNTKVKDIEDKIFAHSTYITTNDFNNNFSTTMFNKRLKRAKLATNKDLDTLKKMLLKTKKEQKN